MDPTMLQGAEHMERSGSHSGPASPGCGHEPIGARLNYSEAGLSSNCDCGHGEPLRLLIGRLPVEGVGLMARCSC